MEVFSEAMNSVFHLYEADVFGIGELQKASVREELTKSRIL